MKSSRAGRSLRVVVLQKHEVAGFGELGAGQDVVCLGILALLETTLVSH